MKLDRVFIFALNLRSHEQKHSGMLAEVEGGARALKAKHEGKNRQVVLCWCSSSGVVQGTEGQIDFSQVGQKIAIYIICESDTTAQVASDAFVKAMLEQVERSGGDTAEWSYLCLIACLGYQKKQGSQSPIGRLAHHLVRNNLTPDLAAYDSLVSIMYPKMPVGAFAPSQTSPEFLELNAGRKTERGGGGLWVTRKSRGDEGRKKHKFKWSYEVESGKYLETERPSHHLDLEQVVEAAVQDLDLFGLHQEIQPILIPVSPRWIPDDRRSQCKRCTASFGLFTRRHHCRGCGEIFCDNCTKGRRNLENPAKRPNGGNENGPFRVCDDCLRNRNL